jgi:hypothetical protein
MKEAFNVKGVEVIVEYNDLLYTHEDIEGLLKYGAKSMDKLEEIQSEIEIVNYFDIIDRLFPKKNVIEKTLDLTNYLPMTKILNKTLETLLSQTFRIEIVEKLEGNVYRLRGPKSEFKDLEMLLSI